MMEETKYPCEIIVECVEYPYVINPPIVFKQLTLEQFYELLDEAYDNASNLLKRETEEGPPAIERVWVGSKIRDNGELVLLKLNLGGVWWRDKKSAPNKISDEEERYLSPTQSRVNGRGREKK